MDGYLWKSLSSTFLSFGQIMWEICTLLHLPTFNRVHSLSSFKTKTVSNWSYFMQWFLPRSEVRTCPLYEVPSNEWTWWVTRSRLNHTIPTVASKSVSSIVISCFSSWQISSLNFFLVIYAIFIELFYLFNSVSAFYNDTSVLQLYC